MKWLLSLFTEWRCSVIIFLAFIVIAIIFWILSKCGKKVPLTAGHILFIGTFVSAVVYFMPWYSIQLENGWQAFMTSVQHAFRLFSFDGDFVEKVAEFKNYPEGLKEFRVTVGSFLYLFAPALTLSFILSFFKNLISHLKYIFCFWAPAHVFSELNEKTLALANSIHKKAILGIIPKELIVFADIVDKKEELNLELIEKAKKLGAILFRKDIESIHFKRKYSLRSVKFYLISEDESEKIRHAQGIINNYDYNRVELYVFSDDIRTEMLMTTNKTENIRVKRVNDIRSLVYDNLDKNGHNLFLRARQIKGEKDKVISAVIIGLGKYGSEMLKALTWFGQLEGYKLKINAFDADEKAEQKFKALCPELMDEKHNKNQIEGEPYYEITIHSNVDISVPDFENRFKQITDATYVFVCLGDDEMNLNAAAKIRAMCQRIGYIGDGRKPDIETVIYDSNVKKRLGVSWDEIKEYEEYCADKKAFEKKHPNKKPVYGATNFKNQMHQILMIGDLKNFYSYDTIIDSDLIKAGFEIHLGYNLDYQKVCLAESRMLEEWNQFVMDYELTEAWEKYLSNWKKDNEIKADESFNLCYAKSGFSFMTLDEEEVAASDEESLLKIKNTAAKRIEKWEKQVFARFAEIIKTSAEDWEKTVKAETENAHKSFLFEYNYSSSIAKAIHKRLRKKLGYKQDLLSKSTENLSLSEKVEIGMVEHIRWNAYMRTEGYIYAPQRYDLGKMHYNLVPVSELSNDDLRKDA